MSLMHFNTHVGLAQGHSNYLRILNLESGTNQSYMPRKKQCVCVCVCVCLRVGGGGQLLQGAHSSCGRN